MARILSNTKGTALSMAVGSFLIICGFLLGWSLHTPSEQFYFEDSNEVHEFEYHGRVQIVTSDNSLAITFLDWVKP